MYIKRFTWLCRNTPVHNRGSPHKRAILLLFVCSELLQLIKRDLVQGFLVRSVQEDLWYDLLALRVGLVRIKGFSPSGNTKTPLAASLHTRNGTQVIALLSTEVQELFGDLCRYSMVTVIRCRYFAVAIAQEACHGLCRMQRQRLLKDVQALAHGGGGVVVMVKGLLLGCKGECKQAEE